MSAPRPNYRAGGVEGRPTPKDRWRTPSDFFQALNSRFRFGLDAACDSGNCLLERGLCVDEGFDGLLDPWDARAVWCNPPYSRVEPWVQKAVAETRIRAAVAVLLIPADVSVGWWGRWVAPHATRVEFVSQRLRFDLPDGSLHRTKRGGGSMTTPSAVVIYTPTGGPPSYGYLNRQGEPVRLDADPPQLGITGGAS